MNERPGAAAWPSVRFLLSVAWLNVAIGGTLLFLRLRPGAAAAVEAGLGQDLLPFLRIFSGVLLLAWGALVLKLQWPPPKRLGSFRWFVAAVIILAAIAAAELALTASADS